MTLEYLGKFFIKDYDVSIYGTDIVLYIILGLGFLIAMCFLLIAMCEAFRD